MMAALFILMTLVIGFIYFGKRKLGIIFFLFTLVLCSIMLWYHATSSLQISW